MTYRYTVTLSCNVCALYSWWDPRNEMLKPLCHCAYAEGFTENNYSL